MIIETKNLSIGYNGVALYNNLNLELKKGSLTAMLGVNGSGKSTLLRTLCGFAAPLSGDIYICGKSLKSYSKTELSSVLSVVLTDRISDGGLTVYEVVSMGRYPYTGFFGRLSVKDEEAIDRALLDVGIEAMRDRYISELSDGEKQKVMIAKSLAQESQIIILDEPTSFLDLKSRMETISLLRRLCAEKGSTFLLSLHDLELSLSYADNLWILSKEDNIYCGQTEEMILSGLVSKAAGKNMIFDTEKGVFISQLINLLPIKYEGEDLKWVKNAITREGFIIDNEKGRDIVTVKSYSNIAINGEIFSSIGAFTYKLKEMK